MRKIFFILIPAFLAFNSISVKAEIPIRIQAVEGQQQTLSWGLFFNSGGKKMVIATAHAIKKENYFFSNQENCKLFIKKIDKAKDLALLEVVNSKCNLATSQDLNLQHNLQSKSLKVLSKDNEVSLSFNFSKIFADKQQGVWLIITPETVSPGQSGSPVWNEGKVVGILSGSACMDQVNCGMVVIPNSTILGFLEKVF